MQLKLLRGRLTLLDPTRGYCSKKQSRGRIKSLSICLLIYSILISTDKEFHIRKKKYVGYNSHTWQNVEF